MRPFMIFCFLLAYSYSNGQPYHLLIGKQSSENIYIGIENLIEVKGMKSSEKIRVSALNLPDTKYLNDSTIIIRFPNGSNTGKTLSIKILGPGIAMNRPILHSWDLPIVTVECSPVLIFNDSTEVVLSTLGSTLNAEKAKKIIGIKFVDNVPWHKDKMKITEFSFTAYTSDNKKIFRNIITGNMLPDELLAEMNSFPFQPSSTIYIGGVQYSGTSDCDLNWRSFKIHVY